MSFFYDIGQLGIFNGDIDLNADTFRGALVDTTSNAATVRNISAPMNDMADITNINATGRISVVSPTVVDLASGNTSKWDSGTDLVFTSVSGGPILGVVIYKFVTDDAASTPIVYLDGSPFPITTSGDNITIQFNSLGIGTCAAA